VHEGSSYMRMKKYIIRLIKVTLIKIDSKITNNVTSLLLQSFIIAHKTLTHY